MKVALDFREVLNIMSAMREWFSGSEIRKTIVSPIMVNVITACILFFTVVAFKNDVLKLLGKWEGVEDYPIYCAVEPFPVPSNDSDKDEIHVDLFIINLKKQEFSHDTLKEELKKIIGPEEALLTSTAIKLQWKEGIPGKIEDIRPDKVFNKKKGEVFGVPPVNDQTPWVIKINHIKEYGILKCTIVTSATTWSITRAARESVPFELKYPRKM